jgi:hypothetical protein
VHDVCGSAVVCGSIIVLRHVVSVRGDELHAFFVQDGIDTCNVGLGAKNMQRKMQNFLMDCFFEFLEDRRRLCTNYRSSQAIIISKRKALIESSK